MRFHSGDIVIRKNYKSRDETTWVSQRLIMEVCDISDGHLRAVKTYYKSSVLPCHRHVNILPDTGKSWRWARIRGDIYYDLKRVPNRNPTCYRERFGDAEALHKSYETAMAASFESYFDTELMYYVEEKHEYYLRDYIEHTPVQRAALAKACAIKMRSMPQNYTNEYIIRTIQRAYKVRGKRVPGRRWFGHNVFDRQQVKFLTDTQRYGVGSRRGFENTGYIPMENALFAGECWQVGATRVNMIEHTKGDKTKGFLFVIAVRDVHSGDIVGHSFDYSENRWSVVNALKMAVENTGYLPYELVTDRFPGHNTDEVKRLTSHLRALGVKVTITHKATGKPHVERSPEYLKEVRREASREGFDLTEAYNEADGIITAYRNTKLSHYSRKHSSLDKSPMALHEESDKPNVKELHEHQISMLFGLKKSVKIKHNGQIKTEIQKADYIYHIEDYAIYSSHYKDSVILSYDLRDLDKVHLFKPSGDLLIHLGHANRFEKPQPYGPQAELGKIAKEKQRLRDIAQHKSGVLQQQTTLGDELELLMGRFTRKKSAENAETLRILK